jgi:hypothetical protein
MVLISCLFFILVYESGCESEKAIKCTYYLLYHLKKYVLYLAVWCHNFTQYSEIQVRRGLVVRCSVAVI